MHVALPEGDLLRLRRQMLRLVLQERHLLVGSERQQRVTGPDLSDIPTHRRYL